MTRTAVSRWARRYVVASASFLVAWQAGLAVGIPRRTSVALALHGFVLHVLFGKAYSLVPTYFDRDLAVSWAPGVQFPLTVLGALGLAAAGLDALPAATARLAGTAGAVLWAAGMTVFAGALAWTIRTNPTGAATATGATNDDRRGVDRYANAFVPVALAYLALGTYATLAAHTPFPVLVDGYAPRATHLLAAGGATLLLLAVGFRLLPRFMVATPPRWLVRLTLPAGAIAPILLAVSVPAGQLLPLAALLEATAVTGFAAAILAMTRQSDRDRVGFHAVRLGAIAGVLGVLLGLHFATAGTTPRLVDAHLRLNLLGFLGLTVVGVATQFYPPNAGTFPLAGDRTALAAIAALATGLLLQVAGLLTTYATLATIGATLATLGALTHWYLLAALFRER